MGLATSVALPLLYFLFIQAWAYWHYARRGLPFDGMGAAYGILMTLGLGASLCVISFLVYVFTLAKERRFSVSRAIETGLFIIVLAAFLSAVYQFLQIRQNFVALL
jgi:hypothetical protein